MRSSRVPFFLLGGISVLLSLFLGLVSIFFLADNGVEDAGDATLFAFFLIAGIVLMAEGVLMFVLPTHTQELDEATGQEAEPSADQATSPTTPHATAEARTQDDTLLQETSRMIARSDDIFATAKDIVHTQKTSPSHTQHLTHLASMLRAANVTSWEQPPVCGVTPLRRTHTYWLRGDVSELDPDAYDTFISTEAAFNLDLTLPELAQRPYDDPTAQQRANEYLREFATQKPHPYDFSSSLGHAYPGIDAQQTPGEWLLRASVTNDAECVRLPFRLTYETQTNANEGIAALSIEIPRPRCFAVVASDERARIAHARAYALRLSWLLASHAFQNVSLLKRVVIMCHEHGSDETLLAIDFDRTLTQLLRNIVEGSHIDEGGFPSDANIYASFDERGWFVPFSPAPELTSAFMLPRTWRTVPELDDRVLSERCAAITGARCGRDLSLNENAMRTHAASELVESWRALEERSCASVVATLVHMRDTTPDVTISEACSRAITALLDGSVDPANDEELTNIIVSDGALQEAITQSTHYLDEEQPDYERVVSILRNALDPILSVGFYADDEASVYRYFGSIPERIVFNTRIDDHAREVRLVPDSYYNALSILSSSLCSLGKNDEAMAVADEMIRIAPASMDAVMRRVRALENESRIFEAAELIKEHTPLALTPRDAALAHYRLAYMEWKLGREDLAVACYQRSLAWNTHLTEQARTELSDLLESYPQLKRLSDQEAEEVLTREDIPLGFTQADQDLVLVASTLLVDEHAFIVATPLLSVLCSADGDDVMVSIRRSIIK